MDSKEKHESNIRQIFASVVWTHKIQEKQFDITTKQQKRYEFWKIILSALTSSGIISVIFVDSLLLKIVSAIVSGFSLFINIYLETYDLKHIARCHKNSAKKLLTLREEIIVLLTKISCDQLTISEIESEKKLVYSKYFKILDNTIDASNKAVTNASIALKQTKDNTYSDEEIDGFLPIAIRKVKTL